MFHLQSSSGGTTTWTEQAIHPEARKVSSGPHRSTGTLVHLAKRGKYK